jgi:hypothetical protein
MRTSTAVAIAGALMLAGCRAITVTNGEIGSGTEVM